MRKEKLQHLVQQGIISSKLADPKYKRRVKISKKIALKKLSQVKDVLFILNNFHSRKETRILMEIRFFAFFHYESKDLHWYILSTDLSSFHRKDVLNTLENCKKIYPELKIKYGSLYSLKFHSDVNSKNGMTVN